VLVTASLPVGGAPAQAAGSTARVIVGWDGAREEVRALRALGVRGIRLERRLFGGRAGTVLVPQGWEPESFAHALEAIPGVGYAEPDYPVRAAWTPDDPLFAVTPGEAYQWAPRRIQAEEAWDLARGAGALVAVVDTGVDMDHPDLADNIEAHLGWDFVNDDSDPSDDNGHGTHCAGTVAAVTDNATGIAGMAPEARILPVKVLDSGGGGSTSTLAEGINYAVAQGADVISMSVGGATGSTSLRLAVSNAAAAGVVLVAASGNEGAGTVLYPAAYAESLCIGATDAGDARTSYSNYGTALDLMAPGGTASQAIISTVRDGYGVKYGTSMATPHVAGLAALLIGERPHLSPESVATLLSATAVDLGAPGWDVYTGSGLVQARAALDHMLSDATPPASVATTEVAPPEGVAVTITAEDIGLGVDRVEWVLDDGVSGRGGYLEITTPGLHILEYAAVDIAGNREATRAVSFEVTDTLPPVTVSDAEPVYYGGVATVLLSAADQGAGVATTLWSLDGAPPIAGTEVITTVTGDHSLAFRSIDLLGHEEATQTVAFRVYGTADVRRLAGIDRYATAVAAARSVFADGSASTVVVASGEDFADALAASGLAGTLDAPVLLTRRSSVPDALWSELTRLGARTVVLVGGPAAVDPAVEQALTEAGIGVDRLAGANRYETAAVVAARLAAERGSPAPVIFLARGDAFADALALAPLAYRLECPVLLALPDLLSAPTEAALAGSAGTTVVIAGGVEAISPQVAQRVRVLIGSDPVRLGGDTRYATAAIVAGHALDLGWAPGPYVGVATGLDYPDALAGGVVAGASGGVMLLTTPGVLTAEVRAFVEHRTPAGAPLRVLGGTDAVSLSVSDALSEIPLL